MVKQFPIGYAVQSTSARHGEIIEWYFLVQCVQKMKEYFLETMLQAESEIYVALGDFAAGLSRRAK